MDLTPILLLAQLATLPIAQQSAEGAEMFMSDPKVWASTVILVDPQDPPPTLPSRWTIDWAIATTGPSREDRINQGLMLGSVGMSSMALGLTMICITDDTCDEVNPVMRYIIGEGATRAVVFKSVSTSTAMYMAWRYTSGKTRMLLLGVLFAVNSFDAINNLREMRKIYGKF